MVQTSSITTPCMVGIVHQCAGCRRKSVMFFVCLFVTLLNYEACDNGNAIIQCNFQNNYGTVSLK